MKLTYTLQGDYLLPDLEVPETPRLGKYGMLHRSFLREHRKALYTGMLLADTLNTHLEEVYQQANALMENLLMQMAQSQGVTEELKAKDQLLWVQRMENLRQAAEETVLAEVVYI